MSGDPFGSHVVRGANERIGITLRAELTGHTEIAKLNLPISAEQDVAWLDVSMNNTVRVQVGQAVQYAFCDLAKDLFAGAATKLLDFTVNCVQGPTFAELHGNADRAIVVNEGTPVPTDVIAGAILVE